MTATFLSGRILWHRPVGRVNISQSELSIVHIAPLWANDSSASTAMIDQYFWLCVYRRAERQVKYDEIRRKYGMWCPSLASYCFTYHQLVLLRDATYGTVLLRQVTCLSVTLRYCDHIGWNSLTIISRLVSLGCSLSADPNITDLLHTVFQNTCTLVLLFTYL